MKGLDYQNWTMRFVAGLNQKADERSIEPPDLARCVNVQFDEIGGLQTRYPYAVVGANILGGGTITDARRVVEYNDEILLFTETALYSWNAQLSKWVLKGTHLAVKMTERNVFVTGGEQIDHDRAELDNVIMYAWSESSRIYVAALDKSTGSVLLVPTAVGNADSRNRPRLVALTTKILLFANNVTTSNLDAITIDPADVATGVAASMTALGASVTTGNYDACKIDGADSAILVQAETPSTAYTVTKVTAALAVTVVQKARACDGPIAVSSGPTGAAVQVVRANGTAIEGDLLLVSDLTDVIAAQAIGTVTGTVGQIACAHRSVAEEGGAGVAYRCYAFWSGSRSVDGANAWQSRSNWVDTAGALGTEATFLRRMDPGSRAFDYDGRVYLWMLFGTEAASTYVNIGQLQNSAFLYRDDGFLCAKSTMGRQGGFLTAGHLPGVQSIATGVYAFCSTERTVLGDLASNNFTGKRPRDVTFTFDSNEARRTAQLGKTLYVSGGEILQYDGTSLTEAGFHVWPWHLVLDTAAGGAVEEGTYAYKASYRSDNAQAERDRSASIPIATVEATLASRRITGSEIVPLYVTHKTTLALEIWRTLKDPLDDSPYYLATASDPSDVTNPNRYLPNDTTIDAFATFHDERVDSEADDFGANPQDVTLPSLAPPAATIIFATDTRIFLAGVAGDPNRVWYSKPRRDGEVAAFHGALAFDVPPDGGDITGIAFRNETLIVFREAAVYVCLGEGYDQTGGGQNYVARRAPGNVGAVNHECIGEIDRGLVFKSSKGWHLLNGAFQTEYIGGAVSDYDSETPLAVQSMKSQNQLRILTSSRMLVLDTLVGQWSEWTVADGVHACMWNGLHTYLTSTGPKQQLTAYTGVDYGMDVETGWIKLADLQGFGRVRELMVLGEYLSTHHLRVRLARDYLVSSGAPVYFDDRYWTPSPTTVGGPLQVTHGPSEQQVQAIKVRLTAMGTDDVSQPSGEALKLTGLSMRLGIKPGLYRRLPAAQQQ